MAKKNQNGRFIVIFHVLQQLFDFVGVLTSKHFHVSCSNVLCMFLMTSLRTKSIVAEKKWPIYCDNLTLWSR